jgi:hypothetical protein
MGTEKSARAKRIWMEKRFQTAKEKGISLNREKLLYELQKNFFCTPRYAKELLKSFLDANIVHEMGEEIVDPQVFKEFMREEAEKALQSKKKS